MDKTSEALLDFLRKRKENRGDMAALRCALVENKRYRAWPLIACFGGIGDNFHALAVQHVAGLFALHPEEIAEGNFGDTCRGLMNDEERQGVGDTLEPGPISRRFQHLLAAEGQEIFRRVLCLTMRAKAKDVPVNYVQLFEDLSRWHYATDSVRTRWARSFWAPHTKEAS